MKQQKRSPASEGITGYLYIRCEKCGKEFGYSAKSPKFSHQCKSCGWFTKLKDLHPMHTVCKCGKRSTYKTNINDPVFSLDCFVCGAPIDVAMTMRGQRYTTIMED